VYIKNDNNEVLNTYKDLLFVKEIKGENYAITGSDQVNEIANLIIQDINNSLEFSKYYNSVSSLNNITESLYEILGICSQQYN
jgi:hypothetical protein